MPLTHKPAPRPGGQRRQAAQFPHIARASVIRRVLDKISRAYTEKPSRKESDSIAGHIFHACSSARSSLSVLPCRDSLAATLGTQEQH